jgi:hypothetical protein
VPSPHRASAFAGGCCTNSEDVVRRLAWGLTCAQTVARRAHWSLSSLRVGSKKPQGVARPRRALPGLGAASPLSDRHSERGPGFRRRLCATATRESSSTVSGSRSYCLIIPDGQSGMG